MTPGATYLGIKAADLPRFSWIAAAFALTQVSALLGYLTATTLFLKRCGPRFLPWTYVAGYVLALALSALFRRLQARVSPFALMAGYFSVYSVFLTAAWWNGDDGSFAVQAAISSVVAPFAILCWMLFWNTLQAQLSLREVKLWTPLVAACANLAQVATGLAMGPLSRLLGVPALFLLTVVTLLIAVAMVASMVRKEPAVAAGSEASAVAAAAEPVDPLLGTVGWLVFLGAVFKYLVDYQLNQAVGERFPTAPEVAGFLGRFDSLIKTTIFLIQTVLAGWLLSRFPPGRVVACMPVLLGLASVAVVMGAGFWSILAANLLFTIFDKGMNRSVVNLLLAPFPPEKARRARLRLDGTMLGSGVIAVSVAMIALPVMLTPKGAFLTLLVLCVVYFRQALRVDPAYVAALHQNLKDGAGKAKLEALGRLRAFSGQARLPVLEELIASDDPDRRRMAARELGRIPEPGAGAVLVRALEQESDVRVLSQIVASLPRVEASPAALSRLLESPDVRVRANVLEALARFPARVPDDVIYPHLGDPAERARASAAFALVMHSTERPGMGRALDQLRGMLGSPAEAARAAACWALGRIGHAAFVPELVAALSDAEVTVRRQAALALEGLWSPAALPALSAALERPDSGPIRTVLERAIRGIQERTTSEVVSALGMLSARERMSLSIHLADLGREEARLLALALKVEEPEYRLRLGQALQAALAIPALAGRPVQELLARVIVEEQGQVLVRVEPVLEALGDASHPPELWGVLERLTGPEQRPAVARAAHQALIALARHLTAGDAGAARARQLVLMSRLLGLAVGDGSVGHSLVEVLTTQNARALGLTAELLEKLLPDGPLRTDLVALVDASSDPEALKRAAATVVSRA